MVDRSLAEVFQDIVRNVQEIVRAEVRLAKTEFREEVTRAQAAMLLLATGVVAALFAALFVLLSIVDALALILPHWAATLLVAAILVITAGITVAAGLERFRYIHPTPERTVETIRENVEWAKRRIK